MNIDATASSPADTAGASTENASPNVEQTVNTAPNTPITIRNSSPSASGGTPDAKSAAPTPTAAPVLGADGQPAPTYTPNYKYKAALQEKELDEFWRPLVKDADSEKKVKELFSKVDAFDFVKQRKEAIEEQYESLSGNYEHMSTTVKNVESALNKGDLSSVFRQLNIGTPQIFQWAQQQIARMEMPAEQRQQIEQYEQAQQYNSQLEQKMSQVQQQYEQQATQTRVMQLDFALSRPEVAQFAQAWDANGGEGAFKHFVIEEAKKTFYESKVDLSPEQAIASVMQRFGKFLNVGNSTTQQPQAVSSMQAQSQKPVIPNVTGKAASPIKKVPKTLDDLRKISKDLQMQAD
jgi:hypothetical protein